jgi:hypothetical protein
VIPIPVKVAVGFHYDRKNSVGFRYDRKQSQIQTALLTNNVLPGMNLEDRDIFEREHSSHSLFPVLLNALLNKLVRAVNASASRASLLARESIELYFKICLNSGSFF